MKGIMNVCSCWSLGATDHKRAPQLWLAFNSWYTVRLAVICHECVLKFKILVLVLSKLINHVNMLSFSSTNWCKQSHCGAGLSTWSFLGDTTSKLCPHLQNIKMLCALHTMLQVTHCCVKNLIQKLSSLDANTQNWTWNLNISFCCFKSFPWFPVLSGQTPAWLQRWVQSYISVCATWTWHHGCFFCSSLPFVYFLKSNTR